MVALPSPEGKPGAKGGPPDPSFPLGGVFLSFSLGISGLNLAGGVGGALGGNISRLLLGVSGGDGGFN